MPKNFSQHIHDDKTGRDLPIAWGENCSFTRDQVKLQAQGVANALRAKQYSDAVVVILAQNRFAFMSALYGAMLAECDVYLPHDNTAHALTGIAAQAERLVCLTDAAGPLPKGASWEHLDVMAIPPAACQSYEIPDPDQVPGRGALTVFTSGSTGVPMGHRKSWQAMAQGVESWASRLGLGETPSAIVATVPPQHMYGLEASVMLPLVRPHIAVHDTRAFYPADVRVALECVNVNRVLVSTPLHLSTLLKAQEDLPTLDVIVSATAPLPRDLAIAVEKCWQAPLIEVFGSSETGMLATRRTAYEEEFVLRDGYRMSPHGEQYQIEGRGLLEPFIIPDVLRPTMDGFIFEGRGDDLINVAGKRASLSGLNVILNSIEGVEDGVFHVSANTNLNSVQDERPIAIVVAPQMTAEVIKAELRKRIADVFVPRRLVFVDALPRNTTGKIPRQALLNLLQRQEDCA